MIVISIKKQSLASLSAELEQDIKDQGRKLLATTYYQQPTTQNNFTAELKNQIAAD